MNTKWGKLKNIEKGANLERCRLVFDTSTTGYPEYFQAYRTLFVTDLGYRLQVGGPPDLYLINRKPEQYDYYRAGDLAYFWNYGQSSWETPVYTPSFNLGIVTDIYSTDGNTHKSINSFLKYQKLQQLVLLDPPQSLPTTKMGKQPIYIYQNGSWVQSKQAYSRDPEDNLLIDHNPEAAVLMYTGQAAEGQQQIEMNESQLASKLLPLYTYVLVKEAADGTPLDEPYVLQRLQDRVVRYNRPHELFFIVESPNKTGQAYTVIRDELSRSPIANRNYTINKEINDGIHIKRFDL